MQTQIDQQIGAIVREINGLRAPISAMMATATCAAATWREAFLKIVDLVLEDGRRKNADFGYTIDEIRAPS